MSLVSAHGTILKLHGLKGELKSSLHEDFEFQSKPDRLFLHIDGKQVPFFLESWKAQSDMTIFQFDETPGINDLKDLIGLNFSFPDGVLGESEQDEFEALVGYRVEDLHAGILGEVSDFLESSGQISLIIQGETEVILPMVEEFILEIEDEKALIRVECPEGLIDLNQ